MHNTSRVKNYSDILINKLMSLQDNINMNYDTNSLSIDSQLYSILDQLYSILNIGIIILNSLGNIEYINRKGYKLFMQRKPLAKNTHIIDYITSLNIDIAAESEHSDDDYIVTYPNGKKSYINITMESISLMDTGFVAIIINENNSYKKIENKYNYVNDKLDILSSVVSDTIMFIDRNGTISDTINTNCDLISEKHNSYVNKNIFEIFPIEYSKELAHNVKVSLSNSKSIQFEYELSEGETSYYETTIHIIRDNLVVCQIRNISDRKIIENKIEYFDLYDPLTNLYNRAYYEKQLKLFDDSLFLPLGVVVCSIDNFKFINETLGHSYGDDLLLEATSIIRSKLSNYEVACRVSGNKLLIFFPNCSEKTIDKYVQHLESSIEKHNQSDSSMALSLSIGNSIRFDNKTSVESIVAEANNLLNINMNTDSISKKQLLNSVVSLLHKKDYKSMSNVELLKDYSIKLMERINYSGSMEKFNLFVDFHDLGHIHIPDSILFNTEPLTETDRSVINSHCEVGCNYALLSPELVPISDWILKHHEWWNGEGYPLNLKNTSIPIECRVFAIVEAYIAMISDSPYSRAMSKDEAISELLKFSGVQFDPFIVKDFIEVLD